jgi:hypothetical protein
MSFCSCSGSKNTGLRGGLKAFRDVKLHFAVPLFKSDGTRNSILSSDTVDQSFLDAKINNSDVSQRWYPIGKFKNVTDERADPSTETFNDGSSQITIQGVRTFTGLLLDYPPEYITNLQKHACDRFGVYEVDSCGNLRGVKNSDETELYPIEINKGYFDPQLVKAVAGTNAERLQLTFEFDQNEFDNNLLMISCDDITADLRNSSGLVDVNATNLTSVSTTGFTFTQETAYNYFGNPVLAEDWVLADYTLTNNTTASTIVITSVTEAPNGTYAFVIPAQSSSDVLSITGIKDGLELITFEIPIP